MRVFSAVVQLTGNSGVFVRLRLEVLRRYIVKYFACDLTYRQLKYILAKLIKIGMIERRTWYEHNKADKLIKCSGFRVKTFQVTK